VCFTILVLPVLPDEEYWSFQYCWMKNTGAYWNTRIVDLYTIPEAPVFFIQQYW
jgi:hypothetical protein